MLAWYTKNNSGLPEYVAKSNPYREICEKLKAYEDLEEQGLLLRLKLKVGDLVWDNWMGITTPYEITGYSFGTSDDYFDEPVCENKVVYYYLSLTGDMSGSFAESEIGKTMFLTKEQAEVALEKMKGEKYETD